MCPTVRPNRIVGDERFIGVACQCALAVVTTDQERLNVANKMADKKKATSRSQMAERRTGEKAPAARAEVREGSKEQPKKEQPRKEQPMQGSKRRDTRNSSSSTLQRLRNSRAGRFIGEAYYELRYKVTWPTFVEARNMTFVVVVLSVVVGCILGLVDYGLYSLFLAISGR